MVAAPPPSPVAVVRAWSRDLNRNDNAAAARLFASEARVVQPGVDVRVTFAIARAFNDSLPCGGKIVALTRHGNVVTATFKLTERPWHRCDAPGQEAAAAITVVGGKIVNWEQIPVPAGTPTA